MEFDLHSNNVVLVDQKQNTLDWSFIGDSLLLPDISQVLSDVDALALAPLPETMDPYYDHDLPSLCPFGTTTAARDDIFPWNDNFITFTDTEILDPVPPALLPNISDELQAYENAKQETPPPNGFISYEIFPNWNMNSVTLLNNYETFAVVPPTTLASNVANRMDNAENFKEKTFAEYSTNENYNKMEERGETERRETGKSRLANISHAEMKKYFSVPITRAAKELNVGLTILKKRCRELGIPRWPHRKIKSLKSLISNVQELGKESAMESSIRKELEMLETHKQLMEDNPEMQLTERTKKLRQACFKANYKKRRARATHHYH